MAFKVFKYPVDLLAGTVMPKGARILSVQVQADRFNGEAVMAWAIIDERVTTKCRRLITPYGTGHELPLSDPGKFLGTVQLQGGSLVLHMFDQGEAPD